MISMSVMADSPDRLFKLLGDETRLRVIRLLMGASLTVTELKSALELPQSTISRHLGAMRRGGVVSDRREGAFVWYSLADMLVRDQALMSVIEDSVEHLSHAHADRKRLESVLEARREATREFFDSIAGNYQSVAKPGGGSEGLISAMMLGMSRSTIVDVGCGEGQIAVQLAKLGHRVLAVDSSRAMLAAVRKRLKRDGIEGVELFEGDVESLPLDDGSGDMVLLSQILHHASRPERALAEAVRVCVSQGRVVVLDMLRHDQEWTREKMGDLWLGFDPVSLRGWMQDLGLEQIYQDIIEVENGLPLIAIGGTCPRI